MARFEQQMTVLTLITVLVKKYYQWPRPTLRSLSHGSGSNLDTSTKMAFCDGFEKQVCNGLVKNRYKKSQKNLENCFSNSFIQKRYNH